MPSLCQSICLSLVKKPPPNSTCWFGYSYSPLRHGVAKYFAWNHTQVSGGTLILTQAGWFQSPSTDPPDLTISSSWGCWGHTGRQCRWSIHRYTSPTFLSTNTMAAVLINYCYPFRDMKVSVDFMLIPAGFFPQKKWIQWSFSVSLVFLTHKTVF